jgi:hypothetical protein
VRFWLALVSCLLSVTAGGHDLITAGYAQESLNDAALWQRQIANAADTRIRAEAHFRLGVMLDEIRDLLNRDLAAHGEVQGLASNFLVAQLEQSGTPLAFSAQRGYFLVNSDHYRAALRAGLAGEMAAEAKLRLLRGEFYDSFGSDPLSTTQSEDQLREQLRLAETLLDVTRTEPQLEEVRFITTILYARAARAVTQPQARIEFRGKALATAAHFEQHYPDSLRSAAMPVLRESLRAE